MTTSCLHENIKLTGIESMKLLDGTTLSHDSGRLQWPNSTVRVWYCMDCKVHSGLRIVG